MSKRLALAAAVMTALCAGVASAAPLSAEQQALFREAAAGMAEARAATEARRIQARRLAGDLGSRNDPDAALFLIELGNRVLFADFAVQASNLVATPELEVAALRHLADGRFDRCLVASVLRQHRTRALFDALLAEARRPEPSHYPILSSPQYCVRALGRTALPGVEAELAAVLATATDPLESRRIAELLVERKYTPAEPAFIAWLDRHALHHIAVSAWVAVKLETSGMANGLARQLARYRDQAQSAESAKEADGLIAALRAASPGFPVDPAVLSEADLPRFSPPLRDKVASVLQDRSRDGTRAAEVNTANFLYWVQRGATDRVRDFLARGANPNATGANANERPLLVAMRRGSWDAFRLLLDAGADPNVVDWQGNPILKLLAERKSHVDSLDGPVLTAARQLLDKGARPNVTGESRRTALHSAAGRNFIAMAALLIERSANVNAEAEEMGIEGLRPLQIAEDQKYEAMARLLRSKGATTNGSYLAKRSGREAVIKVLGPVLRGH
jgi:hypothetical protein